MRKSQCGTIIFGARRESFAILAADRLYYRPLTNEPTEKDQKITVHEKLPIAVAVAGMRRLPVNVGPCVRDHVKSALDSIDDNLNLTLNFVKELLILKIGDLVKQANPVEIAKYRDKELGKQMARCKLVFATMEEGKARMGTLDMGDTIEYRESPFDFDIIGPDAIPILQARHRHDERAYLGVDIQDVPSLADRIRAVMEDAIQIDHAIADEKKQSRTADGPIDCFVVNKDGAFRHNFE